MKVSVNWKQIDKFSQSMFTSDIPTVGKHMRIVELSRSSRCQAILFYTLGTLDLAICHIHNWSIWHYNKHNLI